MKKLLLLLLTISISSLIHAQSCAWPGYSNEGNFSPGCTPSYTAVPTMGPGHYFTFTAYAGITYEFENCATGNWDSDVRIMRNDNGTELHYHDGVSSCGAAGCGGSGTGYHSSNNQWASTYTGAVRVVLSRYNNCGSGVSYGYETCQTSTTMNFRAVTAPSIGTYAHPTLYTCSASGFTYSAAGNIVTNSVSGTLGGISWQWGTAAGAWNSWGSGLTAGGNCCFPLNTGSTGASRMRAVATNGGCTVYGPIVYVVSDNMTAPTSATSSLTTVCSSSPANITLSYSGGATGVLGSAEWYTGSCGGTSIGSGNSLSIPKPTESTTYFVRFENPCTQTTCAEVHVSVPIITLSAEVTNPSCFGASDGAIDLTVTTTPPSFGSSLTLWTKGDVGIETNAGNDVVRWRDQSGNSNDFVTNAGSNTKIQASSINGKPAIRFNNSGVMETPNFVSNPYTMLVVGKMNSGTNARLVSSGSINWLFGWWGGFRDRMYANGWVLQGPNSNITDPYLYSVTGSGSLTSFYRNGTQIASNAGGVAAPGIISLGGWGTGNSELSNGDVAEVLVYNKVLSDGERQEVEAYLGTKYNIGGPTGTQTYLWSPGGAITEDVTGLADGSYSVTVTTDGCAETLSGIMVEEPADIVVAGSSTNEACPADNDGTITPTLSGGFTGVQYVRLTQNRPNTDNAINLQELQAFEIFTGTNVAQGKTVTGTGAHASYPYSNLVDNVFDNSTSGMYHSGAPYNTGDYVEVNLGAAYNLDNVVITNRSDCCQFRADDLIISLYDAGMNLLYKVNVDASAATFTQNVLNVSWSDAATTLNRTGLDNGSYTLSVTDVNGCTGSNPYTIGTDNSVSTAPTTATATPTFVCSGDAVGLSLTGGSLGTGATWEWYSNAALTVSAGSGASITVNPTTSTTYYVRAEGTCNTTSDVNTVEVLVNGGSTAPSGASLVGSTAASTCNVSGTQWHYFYNTSGDLLAAINPNGNNLGSVTVDITVGDSGPFGMGNAPNVCGFPGSTPGEYTMARYWDITVATQPSSAVDVKFYYLGAELTAFQNLVDAQSTAYRDCWGDVNGESDLMMTVDHGGSNQLFSSLSTIAGPGTDIREYQFALSQFSGGKLHSNGGVQGANPLPVELISWKAKAMDDYIALTWSTATEINNDGFEMQRSTDGVNFEVIGWEAGAGNTTETQNYLYEDSEVLKGVRYYYRLKQIDNDGTSETFSVVSAIIEGKGSSSVIGNVIPNPSKENSLVKVNVQSNVEELVTVVIYNHVGARVASYTESITVGSNSLNINTNDLSSGTYFINFEGSFGRETRKLVLIK